MGDTKVNESKFLSKKNNIVKKNKFMSFLNKIMTCFLIFLSLFVVLKSKPNLKDKIYNVIYNNNFSFSKIHKWYNDKFGSIIPIDNYFSKDTVAVFNDSLKYSSKTSYKDGVKLDVGKSYLVPLLESGTVVFLGEKEGYGNTIIVQQINGVDVWYSNVTNPSVKLYDYVEKGSLLANADKYLYLVFQKDGEHLDYKDYI